MPIADPKRLMLQVACCLGLATLTIASPQGIPGGFNFPGSNNPNNGGGNSGTGSGSGSSADSGGTGSSSTNPFGGNGQGGFGNNGANGFANFAGFDINRAMYLRMVHGIAASVAFVFLFPLGSIIIRLVPGRFAYLGHVGTQILATLLYIAAAGIGFWMVATIRFPFNGGSMLRDPDFNFHPIIGIVVFVGVLAQPALGFMHHAQFKKLGRRQIWSHLHLWNGRIMITLGIINGGLGLLISRSSGRAKTAYAILAAFMWVLWFLVAVFAECKRAIRARRESRVRRKEAKRLEREAAKSNSRVIVA